MLEVGNQAPDFQVEALSPEKGRFTFHLWERLKSKRIILAFYPKDSTPGCTKEMCAFSTALEEFQALNAEVCGISFDSMVSHERFAAKQNLRQILLADHEAKVGRLYGVDQAEKRTARRVLFLIEQDGRISHVIEGMPKNQELLDLLKLSPSNFIKTALPSVFPEQELSL